MRLIERTARWVDVRTFEFLPIWYPEHARGALFYKKNWTEPQFNKRQGTGSSFHKTEGNVHANKAPTTALGLRKDGRRDWSCCHIWGIDDPYYQQLNRPVQDHRYFSCIANMVLLPTPLKAFTDHVPDVKAMLRLCARNYYGWACDHEDLENITHQLDCWNDWEHYPMSWPKSINERTPLGVISLNDRIRKSAVRRWRKIQKDLQTAGRFYPREQVLEALTYWNLDPARPISQN